MSTLFHESSLARESVRNKQTCFHFFIKRDIELISLPEEVYLGIVICRGSNNSKTKRILLSNSL